MMDQLDNNDGALYAGNIEEPFCQGSGSIYAAPSDGPDDRCCGAGRRQNWRWAQKR